MSDQKLYALGRVLRQRHADPASAGKLRARIVTTLQAKADGSRWRAGQVIVALVLAAASSAWAAGRYAPQLEQFVEQLKLTKDDRVVQPSSVRISAPPAKAAAVSATSTPKSVAAPVTVDKEPTVVAKKQTVRVERTVSTAPSPESVADEDVNWEAQELEAYRVAHDSHFRHQDYRLAQMLWLQYLQSFPNGKLAPEAKYNRAVALLKLGDDEQAHQEFEQLLQEPRLAYRHGDIRAMLGLRSP